MVAQLTRIYRNTVVKNTICIASRNRQNAIFELKRGGAEAIVVVGGRHSNNTATLVLSAQHAALPVFHVETQFDLPLEQLARFSAIGVASGASTDEVSIEGVIAAIERL
jgi:4-hydroxy-3-methylbut-2-enyl diphosphate reductase